LARRRQERKSLSSWPKLFVYSGEYEERLREALREGRDDRIVLSPETTVRVSEDIRK
jgi:hypothetical protein